MPGGAWFMPDEVATLDEQSMADQQPQGEDANPTKAEDSPEAPKSTEEKGESGGGGVTPPPPPLPPTAEESKPEPAAPNNKRWYVVKVQSGREESIKDAIERRVKIERLEEFYGQILIPIETHVEVR